MLPIQAVEQKILEMMILIKEHAEKKLILLPHYAAKYGDITHMDQEM